MRSGSERLLKIAFALSGAAAFSFVHAAESASTSAPAPEKIEFSRSSTTPKVPRPGATARNEERLNGFGNVFENPSQAPDIMMPPITGGGVLSRSAAEKYLRQWDKKKNWAVPGGEDDKDTDPFSNVDEKKEDDFTTDRPKSRMEQFMSGEESKNKKTGQSRLRDLDRDTDRRNNRDFDSRDRDKRDDRDRDRDENSPRDPNDNSESNGLAEFNLKNFIRQQNGMPTFLKDNPMPKAAQLFRSEMGQTIDQRQLLEREKAQRDARAAEFSEMIKPRVPSTFAGPSDPVNAPDLTRREINPITPRSFDSGPSERPSFGMPAPSPASRIQENAMLGVTGPAASSAAPAVTAPLPRPDNTRSRQIIIDAPRRVGF